MTLKKEKRKPKFKVGPLDVPGINQPVIGIDFISVQNS
jgi:hypothetical protein